jgi:hypothetical protein
VLSLSNVSAQLPNKAAAAAAAAARVGFKKGSRVNMLTRGPNMNLFAVYLLKLRLL